MADEDMKDGTNVRETTLGNVLGVNYGLPGSIQGRPPGAVHLMSGTRGASPGIGMEIFRRFVTFDVPHRTLYLQPNKHFVELFPPRPTQ